MRSAVLFLVMAIATIAPTSGDAQAARVGRLPVLELPPPGVGSCRNDTASAALQREGIAHMVSFQSLDSTGDRLVSLGMNAQGGAVMLRAMMGTELGRRGETETVSAIFSTDGAIINGRRTAFTTGTPARLSDDRQLGLLPTDTLAVRRLAAALRLRCHA